MSRAKAALLLLLILITLALIGWNLSNSDTEEQQSALTISIPTYQSRHTDSMIYAPSGALQYRLIANKVKHYADNADSWFSEPVLTLFDQNAAATWIIRANRAKLTEQQVLYLYGDVLVASQQPSSQLKRIETDSAQVNLITHDVSSEEAATLIGEGFLSHGLKLRGNLRKKNAELIEKVKTTYEINPS